MRSAAVRTSLVVLIFFAFGGCRSDETLTIFAAASFTEIADSLAAAFAVSHGGAPASISVASSSVLARQIEGGAPADVFLSADIRWVERLDSLSLVDRAEVPSFTNRLAVFYRPADVSHQSPQDLTRIERISIGDPDHVPAGRYAKKALQCLGLWADVADNVVPGADTRAALHTFRTGATSAAIGYYSDARFVDEQVRVVPLSGPCAPDIRYGIAALSGSTQPEVAREFLSFILHDDQRAVWTSFGFQEAMP